MRIENFSSTGECTSYGDNSGECFKSFLEAFVTVLANHSRI